MKRDWDVIRQVLLEVEGLSKSERSNFLYKASRIKDDTPQSEHAILLWRAGFLTGVDGSSQKEEELINPELTWQGHDLLATIRSQPIWDRVKLMSVDKGVELTFESVKLLGSIALKAVLGG
tara:strand:- start:20 stop:382 length:363 start_codon:yes stop_codon:yes gene_type:complete